MYESRAYDDEYGQPVAVIVVTGDHDVGRLAALLRGAPVLIEQLQLGERLVRQLRRHSKGRVALELLKTHGGADFTEDKSPTDPAGLGGWLRGKPDDTILACDSGNGWQLSYGIDPETDRTFRAMLPAIGSQAFEITKGHPHLCALAYLAPFTVVAHLTQHTPKGPRT